MAEHGTDELRVLSADDLRLKQLGYQPVLNRTWRKFTNAAVTISAMSVLLSVTAGFYTGLFYGGPAVMVWGWVGVSVCCLCVAAGMSELASAYPTSGGMYYWCFKLLGPERYGGFACWVLGWVCLLGQISSLASTHYFTAAVLETMILLATGTARPPDVPASDVPVDGSDVVPVGDDPVGTGYTFTAAGTLGLYAGFLVLSGVVNSFGGKMLIITTEAAAWLHIGGVLVLMIAVPCIATEHQSAKWVFTSFDAELGKVVGIPNSFYVAILGLLLPAYAYTGYDGPAHMAEESKDAPIANPRGIMAGTAFMAVAGFGWVLSLLFSISDPLYVLGEGEVTSEADGDVVAQILWDAFAQRTGDGRWSLFFLAVILLGVLFCSISTMTYVSRILFCYSRDRAVPLASLWVRLAPNKVPVLAVWGCVFLSFIIAVPSVKNELAFNAILSLSTIALNIAYVFPSFLRITVGRKNFKRGPWHLGLWCYPINILATAWVSFAVVIFSLPTEYPVDPNVNMNYAGVTLGATLILCLSWYFFPFIGAYKWFTGPAVEVQLTAEEQSQIAQMATSGELDFSKEDSSQGNKGDFASAKAIAL